MNEISLEMAREMLELFVGGPEADLIVSAYVPDDDTAKATRAPNEETQEEEEKVPDEMDVDAEG